MSSSMHTKKKKKDILILDKGPIQGLDHIALTAEKEYSINFNEQQKKFCLSLYYNVEIYKFKTNDSEINAASLCLGNVSKDFSADNMKEIRLSEYIYDCLVDCNSWPCRCFGY